MILIKREVIYTNPGSPIKDVYVSRINKNGEIIVEKKGIENIYDYIQSFAEGVDINNIVKKFASGDTEILNKRKGMFLDLTELPTEYFEMVNKINDAKYEFNRLSPEVKAKFGNNVDKFIASIGTNDWYEKLFGKVEEKTIEKNIVKEEVKVEGEVKHE